MAFELRYKSLSFMDLSSVSGTRQWALIGEGFTDFALSMNPITDERHYIHEKNARTNTTGYSKSIAYTMAAESDDPVYKRVALAHNEEQVGSESKVDVLTVKYFDDGYINGQCFAVIQTYTISPESEASGNGGEAYERQGAFNAVGDPIIGSWSGAYGANVSDGAFTPKAADNAPPEE